MHERLTEQHRVKGAPGKLGYAERPRLECSLKRGLKPASTSRCPHLSADSKQRESGLACKKKVDEGSAPESIVVLHVEGLEDVLELAVKHIELRPERRHVAVGAGILGSLIAARERVACSNHAHGIGNK